MTAKIKVLQFPIGNARGGITQYALQNWKFIDKDRFQFDFATMSKTLDFESELRNQGCKVHYISTYAEDNRNQFIKEMNEIFKQGYDIVHLHTSNWKSFLVEELAIAHNIPKIIVHSHNTMVDMVDDQARKRAIELHELRRSEFSPSHATDFWACSQQAAHWLFDERIPYGQIQILKNAIDVNHFTYNEEIRKTYRKMLGIENCFVLGHIGRFVYQKNHEFLIEILNRVSKEIPNIRLMLIGAGELEEQTRNKVAQYGLEEKVLFLGKRSDVSQLLQAMDLFLLPSRFEGLGIVLVEAQAAGLKCLASTAVPAEAKVTANLELLVDDVTVWAENVVKYEKGYERSKQDEVIQQAGYDIRNQIKVLENLYAAYL